MLGGKYNCNFYSHDKIIFYDNLSMTIINKSFFGNQEQEWIFQYRRHTNTNVYSQYWKDCTIPIL